MRNEPQARPQLRLVAEPLDRPQDRAWFCGHCAAPAPEPTAPTARVCPGCGFVARISRQIAQERFGVHPGCDPRRRSGYNALVKPPTTTELLLIRHAPARNPGLLAGRSDVPADCTDAPALAALLAAIGPIDHRVTSPALRCVETAAALWPDMAAPQTDARLWEQDFGDWEGLAPADLPDLGPLPPQALAAHRPPSGESFDDLCTRTFPALQTLAARGGRIAVVAHAGTVRAALALALRSSSAALAFQVAPLSLTQIHSVEGTSWSIGAVNWTARGAAP